MPEAQALAANAAVHTATAVGFEGIAPPPPLPCANCGATLTGTYCSRCGQHVADYHRSVWRFVADFFDNTFCWDNKLLRTLEPLLRRPGFLTREFLEGRRVRYVHPLRLFLFTSALCLTLLQLNYSHTATKHENRPEVAGKADEVEWVGRDKPASTAMPAQPALPVPGPPQSSEPSAAFVKNEAAPAGAEKSLKAGQSGQVDPDALAGQMERTVEAQVARNGGPARSNKIISDYVQRRLSWMALALLPIFALGLRAMYWRQDAYYFGHLVFSLHYHTFLLLFWTAYTGLGLVVAHLPLHSLFELALKLSLLAPIFYLFRALRCMYGDSPRRALIKASVLGFMHLLTIFVGLALVGAVAFFTQS